MCHGLHIQRNPSVYNVVVQMLWYNWVYLDVLCILWFIFTDLQCVDILDQGVDYSYLDENHVFLIIVFKNWPLKMMYQQFSDVNGMRVGGCC